MYLAPAAPAERLVSDLGGQVLQVAQDLAPVFVPYILAMTAIGLVLHKFGLTKAIDGFEVRQHERGLAAEHNLRVQRSAARRERRAAAAAAAMNVAHDEALGINRRRNVRKRITGSYSRESDF